MYVPPDFKVELNFHLQNVTILDQNVSEKSIGNQESIRRVFSSYTQQHTSTSIHVQHILTTPTHITTNAIITQTALRAGTN